MDELTDTQLSDAREVFAFFDTESQGTIAVRDLGKALRTFGLNPTQAKVDGLILEMESRNRLSFEEFAEVAASVAKEEGDVESQLRQAFSAFDHGGRGYLRAAELRHILTSLGDKLTAQEADEFIREADIEGDGTIYYDEFIYMVSLKEAVEEE
ncbi:CALM1 [Cordylochernes scorpioides]|uniref:CALM1 n=1 Tax=Cordylochernes scorpioides TaxID=51811 RepID=A0ABY6KXM3_9ARAC|nr:CALM1 [Cordylochernes scorpioides]